MNNEICQGHPGHSPSWQVGQLRETEIMMLRETKINDGERDREKECKETEKRDTKTDRGK